MPAVGKEGHEEREGQGGTEGGHRDTPSATSNAPSTRISIVARIVRRLASACAFTRAHVVAGSVTDARPVFGSFLRPAGLFFLVMARSLACVVRPVQQRRAEIFFGAQCRFAWTGGPKRGKLCS